MKTLNIKLTDEMLLTYIKKNIESSSISSITSSCSIVKLDNVEANINSSNKISLLNGHVNIYFEDDFRYEFMSHLYDQDNINKDSIRKDSMDNSFVNHVIESHFLEAFNSKGFQFENKRSNAKFHKEIIKTSVLSRTVYIEIEQAFFEFILKSEFGINTKSRVNEKLIKSISNKKVINIDIGLLEQSFNMNEILNLKVGEIIKTNRKKQDGLQILYQETILANNIFVSANDASRLIIG